MSTTLLLILLSVAFLIGLALSLSTILKVIEIFHAPNKWINALPDSGLVKVRGHAAEQPTVSPIAHRPCVFWRVEVDEHQPGKGNGSWKRIFRKSSSEAFDLVDETGKVKVRPGGAEFILSTKDIGYSILEPNVAHVLEALGLETQGSSGNLRNLRASEWIVSNSQPLFIMGGVSTQLSEKIISAEPIKLLISDMNETDAIKSLYKDIAFRILAPLALVLLFFIFSFFPKSSGKH
jgi:hypothetical protein